MSQVRNDMLCTTAVAAIASCIQAANRPIYSANCIGRVVLSALLGVKFVFNLYDQAEKPLPKMLSIFNQSVPSGTQEIKKDSAQHHSVAKICQWMITYFRTNLIVDNEYFSPIMATLLCLRTTVGASSMFSPVCLGSCALSIIFATQTVYNYCIANTIIFRDHAFPLISRVIKEDTASRICAFVGSKIELFNSRAMLLWIGSKP